MTWKENWGKGLKVRRVSLAPSHPANLPLPRNMSVQAWSTRVLRDEVVSVPVTDHVGSFDWNHCRQRRVLSCCRSCKKCTFVSGGFNQSFQCRRSLERTPLRHAELGRTTLALTHFWEEQVVWV
ncbi:hypothetical protein V8G54_012210 [Vigna mungo]|uniref:Uncharacterized protein n=1 Tax=Vigna mungo TaxID=3915 RepID=A0AAQ3S3T0_VIGMU